MKKLFLRLRDRIDFLWEMQVRQNKKLIKLKMKTEQETSITSQLPPITSQNSLSGQTTQEPPLLIQEPQPKEYP